MTEIQFRSRIKKAKKLLKPEYSPWHGRNIIRNGVCGTLDESFNYNVDARELFGELFKPEEATHYDHWLGERNEENIPKRELFLEIFEEYVIINELHYAF